jgi:uncharacterized protein YcbK (DUF882 family)
MAYKTYGWIVKNFSLAEMTNKQAKDEIKLVLTPEVTEFAQMMQELRDWYGKPMEVSSWYRTKNFNKGLKGSSPTSAHLDGRACDINNIPQSLYHDFSIAWQVICSIHGKVGGVNLYGWGMHFTDFENKFGNKVFQIRDKR